MSNAAEQKIEALRAKSKNAVELATIASLASRLEPELLRSLRIAMLDDADASAEADLWLSPLIRARTALFAVMSPDVADALRQKLRTDRARLNQAWEVVDRVHRDAPPALRVEEEITWRVLANPRDPKIGTLFDSVLAAMRPERSGLAHWAARALPCMPRDARELGAAWRVALKATSMLGGQPILSGEVSRASLRELAPIPATAATAATASLPEISVGLRLFESALRISQPPETHAQVIEVPKTDPLVLELELELDEAGKIERRIVSFVENSEETIAIARDAKLTLRTAGPKAYVLERLAQRVEVSSHTNVATKDGLTARAYRGDGAVLLAFDLAEKPRDLAGFSFVRTADAKTSRTMQKFWAIDRPKPGTNLYQVSAVHKDNRVDKVEVELDTRTPDRAIRVGFTRAKAQQAEETQRFGPLRPSGRPPIDFDTADFQDAYSFFGGSAYQMLLAFIDEALRDPESTLDVLAYDIDHPEILRRFAQFKSRLRIVFDDSRSHKQNDAPPFLSRAGCDTFFHHYYGLSHNKVIIRNTRGTPRSVLTGSANFSINSLHAQQNFVIVVESRGLAARYSEYFRDATRKTNTRYEDAMTFQSGDHPPIQPLLGPSRTLIDRVEDAIQSAKSSIIFSLLDTSKSVLEAIERVRKSGKVFVAGVAHANGGDRVFSGSSATLALALEGPRNPANVGHGKFIAIDFNQSNAMVFAGSSAFSKMAEKNGDNVLVIHDQATAAMFAIEALETIERLRFRAALKKTRSVKLDPSDRWARPYYDPKDPHFLERTVLAMAPKTTSAAPSGVRTS